jgi:hypothetical protein
MRTTTHLAPSSRLARLLRIVVLLASFIASLAPPARPVVASAALDFQLMGPFAANAANTLSIRTVVMADFNLDGMNDLATSSIGANIASVWLGNGDGTIGPAAVVATGGFSHWGLATGDVNRDGKPDLVLAGPTPNQEVGVLLGLGNGSFAPLQTYSTGNAAARGNALADFNEDGYLDVVVASQNAVFLLAGNGDGTFQTYSSFPTGGLDGYNLAVGDFSGDNHLDLAVTNHTSGTLSVLLGDGLGSFGSPTTYPASGNTPTAVAAGDLDKDGDLDLAVVQEFNPVHTLEIFEGNGAGAFTVRPAIPFSGQTYPKTIVVGDFDQDGNADLAVGIGWHANVLTFKGNGDLTFSGPVSFPMGGSAPSWSSLVAGDMNGDALPDIAVANFSTNRISVLLNAAPVSSAAASPAANANGWWNSVVTVTFSCYALRGVTNLTPPATLSLQGAGQSASGVCTELAGNTDSATLAPINIDLTAPSMSASASPPPNSAGWNNSDVTVLFDCYDDLSGLAYLGWPAATTLSSEDAGQATVTVTCTDLAGNTAGHTVTGIRIDKTAPTLLPVVSPSTIPLNGSGTVTANASDPLSGVSSQYCGALDTSTAGTKLVTCTATDIAGNTASATASYTVAAGGGFTISGFFQPVDNPPTINQVNAGRAIPAKFSLGGDQGLNIFATGYPASQQVACSNGAPIDTIESTVAAGNSSLSYDPVSDQYTYVWKTERTWAGACRQLVLVFTDGAQRTAQFKFR